MSGGKKLLPSFFTPAAAARLFRFFFPLSAKLRPTLTERAMTRAQGNSKLSLHTRLYISNDPNAAQCPRLQWLLLLQNLQATISCVNGSSKTGFAVETFEILRQICHHILHIVWHFH